MNWQSMLAVFIGGLIGVPIGAFIGCKLAELTARAWIKRWP